MRRPVIPLVICKASELEQRLAAALAEVRRQRVHEALDKHFEQRLPEERIPFRIVGERAPS